MYEPSFPKISLTVEVVPNPLMYMPYARCVPIWSHLQKCKLKLINSENHRSGSLVAALVAMAYGAGSYEAKHVLLPPEQVAARESTNTAS